MTDRARDFRTIRKRLGKAIADETPRSVVASGDALDLLLMIPDKSVSLVLTDPPYHSTKKDNIYGDRGFKEDEHFIEWMECFAVEWKRILKPSGTVYVFCSSEMSARLEVMVSKYLRPLNNVTWTKPNEPGYDGWKGKMKKESLRRWYPHSERILMFEHGSYGSLEAYRRSPMGEYLRDCRLAAGISGHELTERTGQYGNVNHGGAIANWEAGRNIPSCEQYRLIVEVLESTGKVEKMLDYEDIIRPLVVNSNVEFTDVWDFMSVRPFKGKHPAEKPQDMLIHMILASSYPGDIVLDCFAGSGSTGVAALRTGRRAVCIEIEEQWVKRAASEMQLASSLDEYIEPKRVHHATKDQAQLALDRLFD